MAVTFDTAAATEASSADPGAVAITVGANSNRVLVCFLQIDNGETSAGVPTGGGGPNSWQLFDSEAPGRRQYIYYLIAPATGAQSIVTDVVTPAAGCSAHVISLYGADQTTPLINVNKGGSGPETLSITNPAGNMALVGFMGNGVQGTPSVGTECTAIVSAHNGSTGRSTATPGVVTWPNDVGRSIIGCSVAASAAAAITSAAHYYNMIGGH